MITGASTRNVVRIMPDRRAITLKIKTAEGTFQGYSTFGRRKPTNNNLDAIGGAAIKMKTAIWQIWQVDLDAVSAPAPRVGSQIVQGGETWVVTAVDSKLIRNVWNLDCVKAV